MSIVSSPATAEAGPLAPAKPGGTEVHTAQDATGGTTGSTSAIAETPLYSSPKIYLDPRLHEVFYEVRNPQTGASEYTIPSQTSAKAYEVTQQGTATAGGETGHQADTGTSGGTGSAGDGNAGQQAEIAGAAPQAAPAVPAPPTPELSSGAGVSAPSAQTGPSSTFA